MNEDDLLQHSIPSVSEVTALVQNVQGSHEKKFLNSHNSISSQNTFPTQYSHILLGGTTAYTMAGINPAQSQLISFQQINEILNQESGKVDLTNARERAAYKIDQCILSTYPTTPDSLHLNFTGNPLLGQQNVTINHHSINDGTSELNINNLNASSNTRISVHPEHFQPSTVSSISDNSGLLRGSMSSCENSLSELAATITPVNMIENSSDSLLFDGTNSINNVFNAEQPQFTKDNSVMTINNMSKEDKEVSNITNVVASNRLLSKLIQSYKPDTTTPLPLKMSEFGKIPNASLKPLLHTTNNEMILRNDKPNVVSPTIMHTSISTSSHELPIHHHTLSMTEFHTPVTNSDPNSLNPLSAVVITSGSQSFPYSHNHLSSNSRSLHSIHTNHTIMLNDTHLNDIFQSENPNRVQNSHQHILNDSVLGKTSKRSLNLNHIGESMGKDRFVFADEVLNKVGRMNSNLGSVLHSASRSDNSQGSLLLSSDQLIAAAPPITSDNDSTLNFIADQQILPHISPMHEISSDNSKRSQNRTMRPVDMFLSDLHSDDNELLGASLNSAIDAGLPSNLVSSTSPVVSEVARSSLIGNNQLHLPELPPSPILESISSDFLVGGAPIPKMPSGHQPIQTFLPSLSATTDLALSFSSHFLDNSNMSIDMGSLSEGDTSLNVPSHTFGEILEASNFKKGSGNTELNFSNALKDVTSKENFDQQKQKVTNDNLSYIPKGNIIYTHNSVIDNSSCSVKGSSLFQHPSGMFKVPPSTSSESSEMFKVPPSTSLESNATMVISKPKSLIKNEDSGMSSKSLHALSNHCFKEEIQDKLSNKISQSKDDPLIQKVSCFKCQVCSFLSLDKKEMGEHMKNNHSKNLLSESPISKQSTEQKQPIKKKSMVSPKRTKKKPTSKKKEAPKSQPKCKLEMCVTEPGIFQRQIVLVEDVPAAKASKNKIQFKEEENINDDPDDPELMETIDIDCESTSSESSIERSLANIKKETSSKETVEQGPSKRSNNGHNKSGRPAASQTMGFNKFKKTYPKVHIPEETIGIRCGMGGCGLRLKDSNNMNYHRNCHSSAFLKCPECEIRFIHWSTLAMHLWKLHMVDMELYSCDICGYKSYSYTKLMNGHYRTHSAERPFLCDVCGKDFKTVKHLRSHKGLHSEKKEELRHNCDMCKIKFAEKRMLISHLEAVHKRAKPFLCNYCGKSFASKSTLNLHIRQHTGEKPFACESCNYRTSDHNSMRRHRMKHTNDRRYSCPYCEYSSIQSSTFKVHLRRKHEIQAQKDGVIFSCKYCTFKTVKKDNFLAHVVTHHEKSVEEQNETANELQKSLNKPPSKKKSTTPQPKIKSTKSKPPKQFMNANTFPLTENKNEPINSATLPLTEEKNQTNSAIVNRKDKSDQQQQQTYYVVGELVPVPHVVNIDVDSDTDSTDLQTDLVNKVLFQGNLSNQLSGPVIMGNGAERYPFTSLDGAFLQSVNINNDGVVQLTPEVIAVPVTSDMTSTMTTNSVPSIFYVTTSSEDESTNRIVQNTSQMFP